MQAEGRNPGFGRRTWIASFRLRWLDHAGESIGTMSENRTGWRHHQCSLGELRGPESDDIYILIVRQCGKRAKIMMGRPPSNHQILIPRLVCSQIRGGIQRP